MSETIEAEGVGWARVRIDTPPDADGWCFCTPSNHPKDVENLAYPEWDDSAQFYGQVAAKDVLASLERLLLEFDFLVESGDLPDVRNDVIFEEARKAVAAARGSLNQNESLSQDTNKAS